MSQSSNPAGGEHDAGDRGDGRDARGHFVKGHAHGGPGRPPLKPEEMLFKATRMMVRSSSALIDHVELGRRYSGPVMSRLVEIAIDPHTKTNDAISAAELIFDRCFGMAPQSIVNFNASIDTATPEERQQRMREALENLRSLFSPRERTIEGEPAP